VETEKVCVNLSAAELGMIDVLVAQGLYTSRSDVIRSGIRAVNERHEPEFRKAIEHATCLGMMIMLKRDLEQTLREGKRMKIFVVGILRIESKVTPELADEAIESIQVLGAIRAPAPVLERLEDRITRNLEGANWL
jgi:Arc/MetJ-type ribon-helix-helix transcriptional regulator